MCLEKVTIALCAPHNPPCLSFDCGKLHLVAEDRIVCDRARGKCVCYFGTCGTVERDLPTKGIDLANLTKVRCADCTPREDNVGDRRTAQEILESPLLQRSAVDEAGWEKHAKLLSGLWRNKAACPYHVETLDPASNAPINHHALVEVDARSVAKPAAEPAAVAVVVEEEDFIEFSSPENTAAKPATFEEHPIESGPVQPPIAEPAPAADGWVTDTVPVSDHGDDKAHEFEFNSEIKNGLESEVGISTSRWAPEESPKTSDVKEQDHDHDHGQDQKQDHDHDQEPVATGPRRVPTVNFSFDPNNAERLRDTTQKFADLKASFLLGTA